MAFWWEDWLPVRGNCEAVLSDFRAIVSTTVCAANEHAVSFPERIVTWMFGYWSEFARSGLLLNRVTKQRRAKGTEEFFTGASISEQGRWADDALGRLDGPEDGAAVTYICLLDSGLNHVHPLISPLIHEAHVSNVSEA